MTYDLRVQLFSGHVCKAVSSFKQVKHLSHLGLLMCSTYLKSQPTKQESAC